MPVCDCCTNTIFWCSASKTPTLRTQDPLMPLGVAESWCLRMCSCTESAKWEAFHRSSPSCGMKHWQFGNNTVFAPVIRYGFWLQHITQKIKSSLDGFSIVNQVLTTLWKPYDDYRVVLWHISKFGSLYYRQTASCCKVVIKSSKSVHKTRNIVLGLSQSYGSVNKVVKALSLRK